PAVPGDRHRRHEHRSDLGHARARFRRTSASRSRRQSVPVSAGCGRDVYTGRRRLGAGSFHAALPAGVVAKSPRFYEELAQRKTEDTDIRVEAAQALLRVGSIQLAFSQFTAAEAAYQKSLDIPNELKTELPGDPRRRQIEARIHWCFGNLRHAQRRSR